MANLKNIDVCVGKSDYCLIAEYKSDGKSVRHFLWYPQDEQPQNICAKITSLERLAKQLYREGINPKFSSIREAKGLSDEEKSILAENGSS
jgi:hypothetical protein